MTDLARKYRAVRATHQHLNAAGALRYARHLLAVDRLMSEIEWTDRRNGTGETGTLPNGAAIWYRFDDEPYDWGDIEPTEREAFDLGVIGVGVTLPDGSDLHVKWSDGRGRTYLGPVDCWGIGFNWGEDDPERVAVSHVIECDFLNAIETELSERSYWQARGVMTV